MTSEECKDRRVQCAIMPLHHALLSCLISSAVFAAVPSADANGSAFHIENSVVLTGPETMHWTQSRVALVPENPPRVILTTQQTEKVGAHGYRDVFMAETKDGARTWSTPQIIPSLQRKRMPEGHDFVMGDICPQWHSATGVVLATGKTFGFAKGETEDRKFERVSYAVLTPGTNQWSGLKLLQMPEKDHAGRRILEPNAGCTQRFDLPDGDILLPIRYRADPKTRQYTTIIARCGFDGTTLTYREHGSELTIPSERGLYEPSVTGFQGRFYATLRSNDSAFVARSQDGINYEPVVEWTYDDGKVLGSYNTQQHWVTHSNGLYLVYTRRGANNDRTFRNRAPLFIARVDLDRLCVLRATEQVLMPDTGLDLGAGFGTMNISASETWVVSSEMVFPKARLNEPNHVRLAKIVWAEPNKLFAPTKTAVRP